MTDTTEYKLLPSNVKAYPELSKHYRIDEQTLVQQLMQDAKIDDDVAEIKELATKLVTQVRKERQTASGVDALMHEFDLSSEEGVALMCLAEALLRIPDKATADKLIRDKISTGDWKSHMGNSPSMFVNASSWGLLITGKLTSSFSQEGLSAALTRAIAKLGEPVIRSSVNVAMRLMGKQFVTGETIEQAIKNGEKRFAMGYRYSYDMLGEAAFTQADADRYFADYVNSIHAVGKRSTGLGVYKSSGVSVKLSAIHPRYFVAQHQRVIDELYPKLKELFLLAKQYDIGLNIDAEEAERLEISLDLLTLLLSDKDLEGFDGIGFVVQAYQKRCSFVIQYLIDTARKNNRKLMVRLVKGAYWDSEIKLAQTEGLSSYPVFTRKVHTDLNYIVSAKKLLSAQDVIYPQFATHNAQTLSTIYHLAKDKKFEFQCLHGMGETLYDHVVGENNLNIQARIYAPVGSYETLLAYLVRRLLENGANSSFVNQLVDENVSIDDLTQDPVSLAATTSGTMHPKVALPMNILGNRKNSTGYDLSDYTQLQKLQADLNEIAKTKTYTAEPLVVNKAGEPVFNREIKNPATGEFVGKVADATLADVENAFVVAEQAQASWQAVSPIERANMLEKAADLLEENMFTIFDLAVREAGKTLNNSIAEVREAADFCRYYASEVKKNPQFYTNPRGVIVTISPWNFPLAIFTGETVAALVAGNTVLAKPAEQTSLMAHFAIGLFHQAGIPKDVLQCLPGAGAVIGSALVSDKRTKGVIFTGSTGTAKLINSNIQDNEEISALIAETGGQNAMIVDSSALTEQVVADVVNSAFDSAGQRCSALRVLYVQDDVAEHTLKTLKGAMAELKVGNPQELNTDVGPVIDTKAQGVLLEHIEKMKPTAKDVYQVEIGEEHLQKGIFVPPSLLEIDSIRQLEKEVFGPILHVVRYKEKDFDKIIDDINSTGYALTSGLHSRIDTTVAKWEKKIGAGNLYVNRNIIGAVVGVQPFGGSGLSGTGPKAGGPLYLQRLTKNTDWRLDNLDGGEPINTDKLVAGVKGNLSGDELTQVLDLITKLEQNSLLGKVYKMQGITGEDNYMRFEAREKIAIGAGSLFKQLQALSAIVISGAKAVVEETSELAKVANTFGDLVEVTADFNQVKELSILLVIDALSKEVKDKYAKREGNIMTFIDSLELSFSLLPLMHEKAVSINTAAAGGNASLMSEI